MALPVTETMQDDAAGLDTRNSDDLAALLHAGQRAALNVVAKAIPEISQGSALMAHAVRSNHKLIYVAAGSSGLMAMADALELRGTFGLPTSQVRIIMAGGMPSGSEMPGQSEDDTQAAEKAADSIAEGDLVIAISASGSTPFALTVARIGRSKGAKVIGIANNSCAALFSHSDIAICLPTPPEIIAGSTRLGAGTAQKVTLNIMSTLMGIELGHVHDGMMVNLIADNDKLIGRAIGMVSAIANTSEVEAAQYLKASGGSVKTAALLASGVESTAKAEALLNDTKGHLRAALARL